MRLDRNNGGQGKYAIVNMRKLREMTTHEKDPFGRLGNELRTALDILERRGILEYGEEDSKEEFFVIKLKDRFAAVALNAYAAALSGEKLFDIDYAADIRELAGRAGESSPWCKTPD